MNSSNGICIYTDGACDPNPGRGGWGVVIIEDGKQRTLNGGEPNTTNNRMELTAAIVGLRSVSTPSQITLFSDSEYVKKGITEWIAAWKRKGWKRQGGVLANVDLWQELDRENSRHHVNWQWIRGHAGHPMNELADQLAVQGRKKIN